MSVRIILLYSGVHSHACTFAEPWIRLLVEVDSLHWMGGHVICVEKKAEPALRLRKIVDSTRAIIGIELVHCSSSTRQKVQRYLEACSWWLCRSPYSATALPVTLIVRNGYGSMVTPERFHVSRLQLWCTGNPPRFHHHVRADELQTSFPRLTHLEVIGPVEAGRKTHKMWERLRHVSLSHYNAAALLPHVAVGVLEAITINGDVNVQCIPSLNGATRLRSITFSQFTGDLSIVFGIDTCASLCALESVCFPKCESFHDVTPISVLPKLRHLCVRDTQVAHLSPLGQIRSIVALDVSGCQKLTDLSPLSAAFSLESLDISRTKVSSLNGIANCQRLRTLTAYRCDALTEVSPLASLPSLSHFNASASPLQDAAGLEKCVSLQRINLNSTHIASLPPLRECPQLDEVTVLGCVDLVSLSGLSAAPALRVVDATRSGVASLEGLSTCPCLAVLVLGECEGLSRLDHLAESPCLEQLDVHRTRITSFNGLASCRRLRTVDARGCLSLTTLSGIDGAPALEELIVSECPIDYLKDHLSKCSQLHTLRLRQCSRIRDIPALAAIRTLHVLDVRDAPFSSGLDLRCALPNLELVFASAGSPWAGHFGAAPKTDVEPPTLLQRLRRRLCL